MPAQVESGTFKRFVQVGRVVRLTSGPSEGKLAVIVEIIDHNRALIDGPSTGVPRQAVAYRNTVLTPYVLPKIARGSRSPVVKKYWDASDVQAKWEKSAWAKKIETQKIRRSATDFDRFSVALLKKQRRRALGKAIKKA